ncbi:glycoside hydrolase, partial [Enterococcus faecium]|nr:glycoside hydrolase [Enterococcus faecium]
LSDAFALGKYHTGSNLCLWKACIGLAEIFEALEQLSLSKRYKNIACKLKESICKQMTIDGPFGEQFLEGIGDEEKTTYSVKHYQKPILEQGLIFLSDVIVDGKINLL